MRVHMTGVILTGAAAALAVVLGGTPSSAATGHVITSPFEHPGDSASGSGLDDVSCTSASRCEAVGGSASLDGPLLAEVWNGTTWARQSVPAPVGGSLNAVSCTAADACEAVGSDMNSDDVLQPVAEHWDGTAWRVQAIPSPGGTDGDVVLYGVSCVTADTCEAVGQYTSNDTQPLTLAEMWNGSTWHQQQTPDPGPNVAGETGDALEAVTCTAASNCEAVGDYTNSSFRFATLAEVWNGSSWKQQSLPDGSASGRILLGVSCAAARSCEAVGNTLTQEFAEGWNGTNWRQQSVASPDSARLLEAVSCRTADACEAVGNGSILAEEWNGKSWVRQSVPDRNGEVGLGGVSCPEAKDCEAVGEYENSSGTIGTVAESWNGTAWKIQTTP
jgi:hypothetical protein